MLTGMNDGDRQMVKVLAAVLTDGLVAVDAACTETPEAGIASADVILNALQPIAAAGCARYDALRRHPT